MYTICPKCQYQRQSSDSGPSDVCPRCGLVFSKWLQQRFRSQQHEQREMAEEERVSMAGKLLAIEEPVSAPVFWGRAILFSGLFLWGWHFILLEMESNEIGHSFMHTFNLVFHEAGHVIFRLFGHFMMVLGGSLLQILVPLIVAGTFLFKHHHNFGAAVGLWWTGQSLMDIAPYINDARARQLPLLGGGDGRDRPWMHDWYNILSELRMLNSDHAIAAFVDTLGELVVLLSLAWGGYLLWQQFKRLYRQG